MFLYSVNETMKMLAHQCPGDIITGATNDDFENVLTAHEQCGDGLFCLSMDMFMLGYICGKRSERARRKKAANGKD